MGADAASADGLAGAAVAFAQALRDAGLPIGLSRPIQFLRALEVVDPSRREPFYWAARLTFCSRREELLVFDEVFEAFWGHDIAAAPQPRPLARPQPPQGTVGRPQPDIAGRRGGLWPALEAPAHEPGDERSPEVTGVLSYSPKEVLREKDFGAYSEDEFRTAAEWMAALRLSAPMRRSRRLAPARRGAPALGATLRQAHRTQGEVLHWAHQAPKLKPRRLVFLCDISGSMNQYSRATLLFLHAAVRSPRDVEAFCFGTRLTQVTRELGSGSPEDALRRAAATVVDWSGGTRLGQCLQAFCDRWGQPGLARGAVVVIMSDGWDRGDPAVLAEQMARLRRLAHRIIWVNPCKGSPEYEPLALGMSTALPYVDEFVAGHNLASLESLAAIIGDARRRRPPGRWVPSEITFRDYLPELPSEDAPVSFNDLPVRGLKGPVR